MQTTKDLPDLDTLDPDAIAKLAEATRAEQAALERIHAALSEATLEDRLSLAALAILKVPCCYFPPEKAAEKDSLLNNLSDEALVSLAIEILEGVQAEAGADAIVPPDCEFDE